MRRQSTFTALAPLGFASVGFAVLGLLPLAPSAQAEDALSLVKQAADVYARDVRGIVGYRSVAESKINAPMFNQTIQSTTQIALKDGVPVQVVMQRLVTNGKEASPDELSKQEAKTNATFKEGKGYFKAPYDTRHMDTYTFSLEEGAPSGMMAIRFSSGVKDDQHGKGVFLLDARKRVREVRYTPNAFPPNVTRGSVILERDEVAPGMSGLSGLKIDYQGAMGLIKGSFTMDQRNDGFRRYASIEEALAQASKP